MNRLFFQVVILILISFLLVTFAWAQDSTNVPTVINYQGYLTDSSGKALTDQHKITFRIYREPTGLLSGLWEEVHDGVTVSNGMVNVLLGSINALSPADFKGERYLGIQVGAEAEMEPRMRLASVAYSLRSDQANESNYAHVLSTPDNNLLEAVIVTNDGDVGVGKSSPQAKLDVNGSMKVSGKFDFANAFGWNWVDTVASMQNEVNWVTAINVVDRGGILLMVQATGGGYNAGNAVRITIDGAVWKSYQGAVPSEGSKGWLLIDDSEDENSGLLTIIPFKTFQNSLKIELYNASSAHESEIRINYLVQ